MGTPLGAIFKRATDVAEQSCRMAFGQFNGPDEQGSSYERYCQITIIIIQFKGHKNVK